MDMFHDANIDDEYRTYDVYVAARDSVKDYFEEADARNASEAVRIVLRRAKFNKGDFIPYEIIVSVNGT